MPCPETTPELKTLRGLSLPGDGQSATINNVSVTSFGDYHNVGIHEQNFGRVVEIGVAPDAPPACSAIGPGMTIPQFPTRGHADRYVWTITAPRVVRGSPQLDCKIRAATYFEGRIVKEAYDTISFRGAVDASEDRPALVALYDATNGPSWHDNTNWNNSAAPIDQWYGVEHTDGAGRALVLDLRFNNLAGTIPSELGNLANLQWLQLDGNNLRGTIPRELASLTNLEVLQLPANDLNGAIPGVLADLGNLEWLILHGNNLSGAIPGELGSLTNLKILRLGDNNLSGMIPGELGSLTNLEILRLEDNDLSGPIPIELGMLTNLETLGLHSNQLSGRVPGELASITNLRELTLSFNNLIGQLPSAMTNLRQLELLWIQSNAGLCAPADPAFRAWLATVNDFRGDTCDQVPGTVPDAPTGLTLTGGDGALGASWTAPANDGGSVVTGYRVQWKSSAEGWDPTTREATTRTTPYRITGLTNGTTYAVRVGAVNAQGTGAWSAEATGMPVTLRGGDRAALIALYNATGGPSWTDNTKWLSEEGISTWYGVVTDGAGRVTDLRLQYNGLTGVMPPELASLEFVTHLWLNDNDLTGWIPTELGGLANLGHLSLDRNRRLAGPVPASFGNLSSLWTLRLDETGLSGALPQNLTNLRNLSHLSMYDSSLCAPDNDEFRMWVQSLGFFNGQFCGQPVPALPLAASLLLGVLVVFAGVLRLAFGQRRPSAWR